MLCLMTLHYLQHAYYTRKGFYIRIFFNIKAILDHKKKRSQVLNPFVIQYLEACSHSSDFVSENSNQRLHASVRFFLLYASTRFLLVHLVKPNCHSQVSVAKTDPDSFIGSSQNHCKQ